MLKIRAVEVLVLGVLLLGLTGCSKPSLDGVYLADFSTSDDPNVALAGKLQNLSLHFQGDSVSMEMSAMGQSEAAKRRADYRDDEAILTDPADSSNPKWVMLIKDEHTLECKVCPKGMPRIWRKK